MSVKTLNGVLSGFMTVTKTLIVAAMFGLSLAGCSDYSINSSQPPAPPTGSGPGSGGGTTPAALAVSSVSPSENMTGVSTAATIVISFNQSVSTTSAQNNVTVSNTQGTISVNGPTVTFIPSSGLQANTSYTVTVRGGTGGITDLNNTPLSQNKTWSFITGAISTIGQRSIRLIPTVTTPGSNELVSLGIPFPPNSLTDASRVRILDEQNNEIPAYVNPIAYWHYTTNAQAIRSVLVQFRVNMTGSTARTISFDYSSARTQSIAAEDYISGLTAGKSSAEIPRILAALSPEWLTASQVAGIQVTRSANTAFVDYENWFQTFYATAKNYSYTAAYDDWLFDRVTAIYKQYVRTGSTDYLQEAYNSAGYYRTHIDTSGSCVGSFRMTGKNCDLKYNYTEALALHYLLTGDSRYLPTIQIVADSWMNTNWPNFAYQYVPGADFWTERHAGMGWLAAIHAYQILGGATLRDRVDSYANAYFTHLASPPDGLGADGCWRHNSADHDQYEFNVQYAGCSPWMTTIIMDAMWQFYQMNGDTRVGPAARGFANFMESYGWRPDDSYARSGAISSYYFASSKVPVSTYANGDTGVNGNSMDWYTDEHNLGLLFAYALATHFTTDPVIKATYTNRIAQLRTVFTYGAIPTHRAFNWAFRGTSPFIYLLQ